MDYKHFESVVGHRFKDRKLLIEALTHSSYSNERRNENVQNNERLEFLGDAVLSIAISERLFKLYTELPEGELTKIRAKVVCEATLSDCAKRMKLGEAMRFGRGEEMTGGRQRASILADAFEALIAAIYLDSGMETAARFVCQQMEKPLQDAISGKVFLDYKTHLQELIQTQRDNRIRYEIVREEGPDHSKVFHTQVLLNEEVVGAGQGRSKKEAEQEAARAAIASLEISGS
ncbi:ribonuclease III [Acidaminobacter hydrogenoformans]|uniref:Ribonuclease 3 n=1 Tax=Acidaminobacter hydrogenoformans DSM 2784 TaxID=1120920 RepID=A0A1G5RS79_9FIRM|nr:ribonuclease III [Acidaminobacter hydrogenoformans]SCZ76914.1 RNAse III [Acidaminobacter hydrogenoformans DSM 2784]